MIAGKYFISSKSSLSKLRWFIFLYLFDKSSFDYIFSAVYVKFSITPIFKKFLYAFKSTNAKIKNEKNVILLLEK